MIYVLYSALDREFYLSNVPNGDQIWGEFKHEIAALSMRDWLNNWANGQVITYAKTKGKRK